LARLGAWCHNAMFRAPSHEISLLNNEIFWIGESKQGCPTLVVRTNYHDGIYMMKTLLFLPNLLSSSWSRVTNYMVLDWKKEYA
jgi:hypothetical protein